MFECLVMLYLFSWVINLLDKCWIFTSNILAFSSILLTLFWIEFNICRRVLYSLVCVFWEVYGEASKCGE